MIYDQLSRLSHYRGLHPNLDKVIDYVESTDLQSLSVGNYAIDDQAVFLMIQENDTTMLENPTKFEWHARYADIHVLLDGKERLVYGLENGPEIEEYREDIGFRQSQKEQEFVLETGEFLLFLPQENHRPNAALSQSQKVRKAVFKLLMEE